MGIIITNANKSSNDITEDQNDDTSPSLTESETMSQTLEGYLVADSENLREKTTEHCNKTINETKNLDTKFSITIVCASFMAEHDMVNESIQLLDNISQDDLTSAQTITLYGYYSASYDKLNDTGKSTEYKTKRQTLLESKKERRTR